MVSQQQQQKLEEPLFDFSMHVTSLLRIKKRERSKFRGTWRLFSVKYLYQRSKYCLEFFITWGRLKISRWPFHGPIRLTQCCTQWPFRNKAFCLRNFYINWMWMPHYNANTIHKKSYPREIWIGYNIELAEKVYSCTILEAYLINSLCFSEV